MRGDGFAVHLVGRPLQWRIIQNISILRHNDQSRWVLSGCPLYVGNALYQNIYLARLYISTFFLHIFSHISISALVCNTDYSAGAENIFFPEHFNDLGKGSRLVFPGKIQVNIRNLIAVKPQKHLKRNLIAVLNHSGAAFRAVSIWQIRAASRAKIFCIKIRKLACRANIVWRQRIDFRNAHCFCYK